MGCRYFESGSELLFYYQVTQRRKKQGPRGRPIIHRRNRFHRQHAKSGSWRPVSHFLRSEPENSRRHFIWKCLNVPHNKSRAVKKEMEPCPALPRSSGLIYTSGPICTVTNTQLQLSSFKNSFSSFFIRFYQVINFFSYLWRGDFA